MKNKAINIIIILFLMHPITALASRFPVRIIFVHASETMVLPHPIEINSMFVSTYSEIKNRVIKTFGGLSHPSGFFRPIEAQEIELNCTSFSPGQPFVYINNPNDTLALPPDIKACGAKVLLGNRFDSSKNIADNIKTLAQKHFSHVADLVSNGEPTIMTKPITAAISELGLLPLADYDDLISKNITPAYTKALRKELTKALEIRNYPGKLPTWYSPSFNYSINKLLPPMQIDIIRTELADLIDILFKQGEERFEANLLEDGTKIWDLLLEVRLLSDAQDQRINEMWNRKLEGLHDSLMNYNFEHAQHLSAKIKSIYDVSFLYRVKPNPEFKARAEDIKLAWLNNYLNKIKTNIEDKNYYRAFLLIEDIQNIKIFTPEAIKKIAHGIPSTVQELLPYLVNDLENQIENHLLAENYDEATRLLLLLSQKDYQGVPIPEDAFRAAYDTFAFRIDPRETNRSLKIPDRHLEYAVGARFISESGAVYDAKTNVFFKLNLPVGTTILEFRQAIADYFEHSPVSVYGRCLKPTLEQIIIHSFDDIEYAKLDWYDQTTNKISNDYIISIKMAYDTFFHLESALGLIWGHMEEGNLLEVYPILDQPFLKEDDRIALNVFYKQLNNIINPEGFLIDHKIHSLSNIKHQITNYNASIVIKEKLLSILNEKLMFFTTLSSIEESITYDNLKIAMDFLSSIIENDTFTKKQKEEAQRYYEKCLVEADLRIYRAWVRETRTLESLETARAKIAAEMQNRHYTEKYMKLISRSVTEEIEYWQKHLRFGLI